MGGSRGAVHSQLGRRPNYRYRGLLKSSEGRFTRDGVEPAFCHLATLRAEVPSISARSRASRIESFSSLRRHLTRFLLEAGEDVREVPLRTERPTEGRPRERAIQVMPWRSPGSWPGMKGCPGVPTRIRRQTARHRHQVGSQCGVDRLSTRPGSNHPRARTCSNQEDRWPSWRSHRWFRRSSPALRWAARSPALPAPDQAPYPSPNRFDLSSCY